MYITLLTFQVLHRLKILTSSEHLNKLQHCLENVSSLQTSLQTEVKVDFDEVYIICLQLYVIFTIFQTISSLRSQSLVRNRTVSRNDLLSDDNPEICLNNDLQDYVSKYSQAYSSTIEGEETTGVLLTLIFTLLLAIPTIMFQSTYITCLLHVISLLYVHVIFKETNEIMSNTIQITFKKA